MVRVTVQDRTLGEPEFGRVLEMVSHSVEEPDL
jgi:hypothetical protein